MNGLAALVSDHLDIWTAATERNNGAGRGGGKRTAFYGIERLRELILDVAVRGKLVPQDAGDEPASMSLERIPDEWTNAKRRHRSRSASQKDDASQGDVPPGWARVAGNVIFRTRSGNSKLIKGQLHSEKKDGLFPGFSASGQDVWLDQWEHEGTAVILSAVGARCGKAFLAAGKWSAIANTHIIWLLEEVTTPAFAMLVLNNESFWLRAGGAQPFVKVGATLDRDLLLPPLAEQRRIVAKVNELMALCDALEAGSAAALAAHQALVETVLAALVDSADARDLPANWSLLQTHFDTLFTTEASIDALKQTILELAVSGRLVSSSGDVEVGTLDDVGDWVGGNGFPKQYQGNQEGEFAFLKVSDMNLPGNERQITVSNNWVSPDALRAMRARAHPVGTIIFPKIGGAIATNKRRILAVPAAIDNNCAGQIARQGIDVDWLFIVLSSIDMAPYQAGTSVPALNMKRLGKHPIAIPSNEAQREIVVKVNAMMDTCDGLKASIADAGQIQARLADAVIERAAA